MAGNGAVEFVRTRQPNDTGKDTQVVLQNHSAGIGNGKGLNDMGVITGLGWLFSGVLKFFPGVPTIVVYALAAAAVIGLPAGYAYHRGSEGKSAAVARCESACTVKLSRIETAAERTISDILSSVDEAGPGSKDVAQYCERHPTLCRGSK